MGKTYKKFVKKEKVVKVFKKRKYNLINEVQDEDEIEEEILLREMRQENFSNKVF